MFCVCTLPLKLQPSGFLPNKSGVHVFNQKNKIGFFLFSTEENMGVLHLFSALLQNLLRNEKKKLEY